MSSHLLAAKALVEPMEKRTLLGAPLALDENGGLVVSSPDQPEDWLNPGIAELAVLDSSAASSVPLPLPAPLGGGPGTLAATPTLTVSALSNGVEEAPPGGPPQNGKFRFQLSFGIYGTYTAPSDIAVGYSMSGDATNGVDYGLLAGSVTIKQGTSFVDLPYAPVDDVLDEGPEDVVVAAQASPQYTVSPSAGSATSLLSDQDYTVTLVSPVGGASLSLSGTAGPTETDVVISVTEGGQPVPGQTVTAKIVGEIGCNVDITAPAVGQDGEASTSTSARAGQDPGGQATFTIRATAGTGSATLRVNVERSGVDKTVDVVVSVVP